MLNNPIEIAAIVAVFVGQAIASYVVGTRKGHRKAVIEGAPGVFGESFLRRAESHFELSHKHAQTLQKHELEIATVRAGMLKFEGEFALAETKIGSELKDLRDMSAKIREDIASLRGALGSGRIRFQERDDNT